MIRFFSAHFMRRSLGLAVLALSALAALCVPKQVQAHFSYSDPRIIHISQSGPEQALVLIRMPAPLALLPEDWQGQDETRLPPFAIRTGPLILLDPDAVTARQSELMALLNGSVSFWVDGQRIQTRTEAFRFWPDASRPSFGTLKSAKAAFDKPHAADAATLPFFDLTLDVALSLPLDTLNENLRLMSELGENFQVIDKLGTVIKLHRDEATETSAMVGVLDVSFLAVQTRWGALKGSALLGAEHIYLGLDHLAIIALIAITALSWRHAIGLATAFTAGHMITLAAGIYGVAPSADWFIPLVELGIAATIIVGGLAIFLNARAPLGLISLFIIGLIHGYGFAASASEAMFAGDFDPLELIAFAAGLELCQFAIYALILPAILLIDRVAPHFQWFWRRGLALGIALCAISPAIARLTTTTAAFGLA